MANGETDIPTPLDICRETVRPEWIDYNGHMNVGYYVLAFDQATDAALAYLGLDEDYRDSTGCSTFTLEMHVSYLQEVHEGDPLRFQTRVLDADAKRVQLFHEMYHADKDYLAATSEDMLIHIDLGERRSAPFPEKTRQWIAAVAAAHAELPRPEQAGRSIGIRRKT